MSNYSNCFTIIAILHMGFPMRVKLLVQVLMIQVAGPEDLLTKNQPQSLLMSTWNTSTKNLNF